MFDLFGPTIFHSFTKFQTGSYYTQRCKPKPKYNRKKRKKKTSMQKKSRKRNR
jgi:hypothetical protein